MEDLQFLTLTSESYDKTAEEYAEWLRDDIAGRPFDRALLHAFAERVLELGNTTVVDVGCGPGRITVLLKDMGLDAFGIDLSAGMVELARKTHPMLRFDVGSMLALDLPSASVGGVLAYYSIIHLPRDRRAAALAEFFRVLAPGGQLMLAFQVGEDELHLDEAFGTAVNLTFYRQQPDEIAQLLTDAGFQLWATAVKEPEGTERTPHGFVMAIRP